MKIVSFAHLTIVYNSILLPQPTSELVSAYQYKNIQNNPSKWKFMRKHSISHDISIRNCCYRVEYISYQDKGFSGSDLTPEFVCNGSVISSESFSTTLLKFISTFLIRKQINERKIQVSLGLAKNNVILSMDGGGKRFERYLDDPGCVAIAFYVDKLEETELDGVSFFLSDYERSEVFDIILGERRYRICIARVEGVHIEFIERVKIRSSRFVA